MNNNNLSMLNKKSTIRRLNALKYIFIILLTFSCNKIKNSETKKETKTTKSITELNVDEIPIGDKTIAIVEVNLVDGIS